MRDHDGSGCRRPSLTLRDQGPWVLSTRCDVPGYLCEVHHIGQYATCPTTSMDNLAFACGSHHRLLTPGGWTTRELKDGDTEWIPPPHLHHGQRRTNTFHHPTNLPAEKGDDP